MFNISPAPSPKRGILHFSYIKHISWFNGHPQGSRWSHIYTFFNSVEETPSSGFSCRNQPSALFFTCTSLGIFTKSSFHGGKGWLTSFRAEHVFNLTRGDVDIWILCPVGTLWRSRIRMLLPCDTRSVLCIQRVLTLHQSVQPPQYGALSIGSFVRGAIRLRVEELLGSRKRQTGPEREAWARCCGPH